MYVCSLAKTNYNLCLYKNTVNNLMDMRDKNWWFSFAIERVVNDYFSWTGIGVAKNLELFS